MATVSRGLYLIHITSVAYPTHDAECSNHCNMAKRLTFTGPRPRQWCSSRNASQREQPLKQQLGEQQPLGMCWNVLQIPIQLTRNLSYPSSDRQITRSKAHCLDFDEVWIGVDLERPTISVVSTTRAKSGGVLCPGCHHRQRFDLRRSSIASRSTIPRLVLRPRVPKPKFPPGASPSDQFANSWDNRRQNAILRAHTTFARREEDTDGTLTK